MGGRRVFVGHGVVFFNDPRPRATIHGRSQAEIDSVSIRAACRGEDRLLRFVRINLGLFRRTSTGVVHRPRTPAAPSRDIAYMTMFFEGSLTCGRRSWLLSVEAAHFVRAPLLLQAAGVRARRYERDSALREVVPADNDA